MKKVEVPALITPEIINIIASNPELIKAAVDLEDNELLDRSFGDRALNCPNLSDLKAAFSNIYINVKDTQLMDIKYNKVEHENKLQNTAEFQDVPGELKNDLISLKEQISKVSEQVSEIKNLLLQNRRNRIF